MGKQFLQKTIFILFLLTTITTQAQEKEKYLIYLTDKGEEEINLSLNKTNDYNYANKFLSVKAIERRIINNNEKELITVEDLPVNRNYVEQLQNFGIKIKNKLKWFNAVSAYITQSQINEIKNLDFIAKIEKVKTYKSDYNDNLLAKSTTEEYNSTLKASSEDDVYDYGVSYGQYSLNDIPEVHNLGFTGQNVTIGLLDAGFWLNHVCFENLNVIAEYDFVEGDTDTHMDSSRNYVASSHGTFVLSLIAGFYEGKMVAPAFNASYVLARTEENLEEHHAEEDNFAAALEWMDSIGVDIVSSSVGYTKFDSTETSYSYKDMDGNTTIVTKAMNLAYERGIVTVKSAGNGGFSDWHYITAPADAFNIIAVGGVKSDGSETYWSSRGPTYDGRIKPEICAQGQGEGITAVESTIDSFIVTPSTSIWGTSGAAPIAAGAIGQLKSAYPHLTNEQVRSIVLEAGSQSDNPDYVRGYGILSSSKAVSFPNLKDMTNKYLLNKIFLPSQTTNLDSAKIHYSNNNTFITSLMQHDDIYSSFEFPEYSEGELIEFYFTYLDSLNNVVREPGNKNYHFEYGDLIIHDNVDIITDVEEKGESLLKSYSLFQNYPNPFNPSTTIKFTIPTVRTTRRVVSTKLVVYDILGRKIKILLNKPMQPGNYEIDFDGSNLTSGVYFYVLETGGKSLSRKMVLIK